MTNEQKRTLRPFQRDVLRILQQEKRSIILQAPTGAGKTDAVLYPYVQCLEHNGDWLARTCLYATPMRVLCNQFYHKFRGRIERLDKKKGGRLAEIYEKLACEPVSLQTGEQPNDPQFEALLSFCTIDQLLASFLAVPYSLQRGRHNLNVGAVIGSYLVLDEFHLYPLVKEGTDILGARTTVLAMLCLLKEVTRFVLMTATFSTTLLEELAQLLDAVVVKVEDDEELRLISNGRQRTFELVASPLSADTILAQHHRCSLVVCNTVLRAQQCYWELKERAEKAGIKLVLLHSRLNHADREARSSVLMHELGQAPEMWKDGHYYGKNLIVVATQVVEVGLDISVETLHTELAPANSLVQRAGRCARFARQQGRVLIYEGDAQETQTTLPYSKALCEKTLLALRDLPPVAMMGFKQEQALIDAVHTEEDKKLLEQYAIKHDFIKKQIFESLCTNERGVVTTLIRDVAQVQVLIHENPNEAIKQEPWRWQSFALHPASLASRWQVLDQRAADLDLGWVGREAVLQPESEKGEPDNRLKAQYQWDILPSSKNTDSMRKRLAETLMIVLHPQLATYHEELGFVLLDGSLPIASTGYQSTPLLQAKAQDEKHDRDRTIHVESYQQHIGGLMKAYAYAPGGLRGNLHYVATRLEELMGFSAGLIDHAICLALACHDLGKLSQAWQQWAWSWQRSLEQEGVETTLLPQEPFFFAKTDFDYSKEQRLLQQMMKQKRPNHACESVMLGFALIADSLGIDDPTSARVPLLYAVCAAIARHHTAQAQEFGEVVLAQGAEQVMRDVLENVKQDATWRYNLSLLETCRVKHGKLDGIVTIPQLGRQHELETWLYFVMVRALRLADQRAGIRW